MKITSRLFALPIGAAVLWLGAAAYRNDSPRMMSDAANALLASLTEAQRAQATFQVNEAERENWFFVPIARKGLTLKEMTQEQRHLAQALLSAGLSQQGYIKATSIMSLEDVLRLLEGDNTGRRDPEKYYFSIFGTPTPEGTWGYRVEGHHLSLNWTVVGNKVASSPMFFGTNPAQILQGPRKGLRVLGREEDLGRELLSSLTAEQKKTAIISATAYKDILTMNNKKAVLEGQPAGLSAAKMTAAQRALLNNLIEEYAFNVPPQLAQARMAQVKKAGTNILFAWAGVEEKGGPHYYRVQTPEFLIEYDNTQNNNNHIHAVWRDFNGDFGRDLLAEHLKAHGAGADHKH